MATRAKRVLRASKGSQAGLGSSSKAGDKRRRAPSLRAKPAESLPSIAHMTAARAIAEADSDGDELEEERSSDLDNETSEAVLFCQLALFQKRGRFDLSSNACSIFFLLQPSSSIHMHMIMTALSSTIMHLAIVSLLHWLRCTFLQSLRAYICSRFESALVFISTDPVLELIVPRIALPAMSHCTAVDIAAPTT